MERRNSRMGRIVLALVAMIVVGVFTLAAAATTMWKWVDDKGTVHYVDALYKVPAKYQKKAVKVEIETPGEASDGTAASPTPPPPSGPSPKQTEQAKLKADWIAKAQNAVNEVKRLQKMVITTDAECNTLRQAWEVMPTIENQQKVQGCANNLQSLQAQLAKAIDYRDHGIYAEAQGAGVPITWFDEILHQ